MGKSRTAFVGIMIAYYVLLGLLDIHTGRLRTGAASLLLAAVQAILFL